MTCRIQTVDINYVAQLWPQVKGYLEKSLVEGKEPEEGVIPDWNDCYNIHHVQAFIANGSWLLVVAVDDDGVIHGAATIAFNNYPMQRVAVITLTGGKLVTGDGEFEQLAVLLRHHGATRVQAYCRESMARMLKRRGFEPRSTLVEAQL
jgi:hypothetical protein